MPMYHNKDSETRGFPGGGPIDAGAYFEMPYYVPLTDELAAWFELARDTPPIVTLVDGAIPSTWIYGDYGLCMYPMIRVNNKSGAELTVYFNNDDGEGAANLKMPAGEILYLENQRDINSLKFSGTGSIQVGVFKKSGRYDAQ